MCRAQIVDRLSVLATKTARTSLDVVEDPTRYDEFVVFCRRRPPVATPPDRAPLLVANPFAPSSRL